MYLVIVAITLALCSALLSPEFHRLEAQHDKDRAELAAYKATLNSCQGLLTQRGNEIARCVDDNEEMANRLAEGIRCPRR